MSEWRTVLFPKGTMGKCGWQHYKGGVYTVITLGKDEASGEDVVIYRHDGEPEGTVWVRRLSVWTEEVSPGVLRFTPLGDDA